MARLEFTRKVRAAIIKRADGLCEACSAALKKGEGEVDHILPCSLGGEPTLANGRLLCRVCHVAKSATDIRRTRKADKQRDKATGAFRSKRPMQKPVKVESASKRPALPPRLLYESDNRRQLT